MVYFIAVMCKAKYKGSIYSSRPWKKNDKKTKTESL